MDAQPAQKQLPAARASVSPLLLVGVPLIVGVLLWVLFSGGEDAESLAAPDAAPTLFAGAAACPQDGAGTAHQRAEDDEASASAMMDRYPFAPEDGVEAVVRFRRAQACFRDSGDRPGADRVRATGDAAQRQLEADYRKRVFRLRRALDAGHARAALQEVRSLHAMLGNRPTEPYVTWLERLEHALELRLRRAAAKKAP